MVLASAVASRLQLAGSELCIPLVKELPEQSERGAGGQVVGGVEWRYKKFP